MEKDGWAFYCLNVRTAIYFYFCFTSASQQTRPKHNPGYCRLIMECSCIWDCIFWTSKSSCVILDGSTLQPDLGWGVPPSWEGWGYTNPHWEGWGYLPSARMGYPPVGKDGGTPPVSWMGVPSPKCEQTDTCENSTFPIPSEWYFGISSVVVLLSEWVIRRMQSYCLLFSPVWRERFFWHKTIQSPSKTFNCWLV